MAYFHEFSLSLFISLSSSPSSFVVEESFWDRLALHSIFESLFSCLFPKKCLCVCVLVDDVNILYFFSLSPTSFVPYTGILERAKSGNQQPGKRSRIA